MVSQHKQPLQVYQERRDLYGMDADQIARVAQGGLDGRFRPNDLVTRAQFVKMVADGSTRQRENLMR
ncbi:MAG: S-layer homology domain-containing protein [Thermoleophilia bacterium]|nr:S-layer homology domain-containing protein [Thermoleophilia bacterium]